MICRFIFYRRPAVGFNIAGKVILDAPRGSSPDAVLDELLIVSRRLKEMVRAEQIPDDAVIFGGYGNGGRPDVNLKILTTWEKNRFCMEIQMDPIGGDA
jgi:hypothetical protein